MWAWLQCVSERVAHDMQLSSRACRARALVKGGVYLGRPGYRPARRMSTRNESAGSVVPGWTFKCQGGTYRRWLGFGISEHETAYGRKSLAELPVLVLQFQRTLLTFFRESSLFLVPADAHDAGRGAPRVPSDRHRRVSFALDLQRGA